MMAMWRMAMAALKSAKLRTGSCVPAAARTQVMPVRMQTDAAMASKATARSATTTTPSKGTAATTSVKLKLVGNARQKRATEANVKSVAMVCEGPLKVVTMGTTSMAMGARTAARWSRPGRAQVEMRPILTVVLDAAMEFVTMLKLAMMVIRIMMMDAARYARWSQDS